MNIFEVRPDLYLIELEQEMEGFRKCIGSWFFKGKYKFLVDVGPKASVGKLIESLKAIDIRKLDFIFLTHIHIDHAGGIGFLIRSFPEAKIICHASGINHLIDPRKLWRVSKKALGEIALKYGEIDPVLGGNIVSSSEFELEGFKIVNTPGHAVHHISLIYDRYLFAGEAAGFFRDLGDKIYLRPLTPPKFALGEAIRSIDRLLEAEPQQICYAHFGIHSDAKGMLKRHKDQLFLWRDVIAEQLQYFNGKDLIERCIATLLEKDEFLKPLKDFNEVEKKTEFFFIQKNIEGFLEYINSS
ncbi:MAG: MBL fold metallo-hydrolase [Thermodesulfobacteriota bacterium]|jgi:glyoxylase-like metal-dependent hydrolase (beta-lactamase superfamily II)